MVQHEATIFGQLWRLEPLPSEKKSMWKREMEWLICVSDHIVELIPSWQTFPDGKKLEVNTYNTVLILLLFIREDRKVITIKLTKLNVCHVLGA